MNGMDYMPIGGLESILRPEPLPIESMIPPIDVRYIVPEPMPEPFVPMMPPPYYLG